MENNIYILSSCDAWVRHNSMRILGVTTDETMLYAMIYSKIKAGDMGYRGFEGEPARQIFEHDFINEDVKLDNLTYGIVQTYEDMQIAVPLSLTAFAQIIGIKAMAELETLKLDIRSLNYSVVEVRTDFGYTSFVISGFCDRDDLENSEAFQEFMKSTTVSEVNASVYSYSVGTGESGTPNEKELEIIAQYQDILAEEYDVDYIKSDFINFYYEAEQEY